MPSCGPVYQPTTVPRSGSSAGVGGFLGPASSVNSPLRIFRRPKLQLCLLLFSLIALAAGVAMLASGTADWIDDQEYVKQHAAKLPIEEPGVNSSGNEESSETRTEAIQPQVGIPLGILLAGVVITTLGLVAMG